MINLIGGQQRKGGRVKVSDLYWIVSRLDSTVASLAESVKSIDARQTKTDRWMYSLPVTGLASVGAVIVAILHK